MIPRAITIGRDGSIYVAGPHRLPKGLSIYHYSPTGTSIRCFYKRDSIPEFRDPGGNFGRLAVDRRGNLYYAFPYTYQVIIFSSTGDSVGSIRGTFEKPEQWIIDSLKRGMGAAKSGPQLVGLQCFTNNFIAVMIDEGLLKWSIDLFKPQGKLLKRISGSSLPDKMLWPYWAVDHWGNFYFNISSKLSQMVVKYKVDWDEFLKRS